jgi:uncharacterized protein (DUF1330 family)
MKTKYHLAFAFVAGAVITGAAMQGLHAQTKPRAYAVVENIVTDKDAYANKYSPAVSKIMTEAGGKFLVRGGRILPVKGEQPKVFSVIEVVEFESLEKAEAAYFSPIWNDARKISAVYTDARIYIVEGVPQ